MKEYEEIREKADTEMYSGVTSDGLPNRLKGHRKFRKSVVGKVVTGLLGKVEAGIMEWAGIRQIKKLIDAKMYEYFEVYIATATSGENIREVGVLRRYRGK